jgi:transposase
MPLPIEVPRTYSRRDLAKLFEVHVSTISRWVETGQLPEPIPNRPGQPRWFADVIDPLVAGQVTA